MTLAPDLAAIDAVLPTGFWSRLREHGERPALLWECERPGGTLRVPGLDPHWSTREQQGEARPIRRRHLAGLERGVEELVEILRRHQAREELRWKFTGEPPGSENAALKQRRVLVLRQGMVALDEERAEAQEREANGRGPPRMVGQGFDDAQRRAGPDTDGDGAIDGPPTEPVILCASGDVHIGGQGVVNTFGKPTDFTLICSARPNVRIAPSRSLALSASAT